MKMVSLLIFIQHFVYLAQHFAEIGWFGGENFVAGVFVVWMGFHFK